MLRWSWLFLMGAIAPTIYAKSPPGASLTVDQVDQLVARLRDASDTKAARQLAGLTLSERASTARLTEWQAKLSKKNEREAITALADAAVFLAPPQEDIAKMPAPSAEEQRQILARAIDYVKDRLPKLPDFTAQRRTTSFQVTAKSRVYETLWYRDLLGPARSVAVPDAQLYWVALLSQFTTEGEFGPVLNMVLADFFEGRLAFEHWEQGASGVVAVFSYFVPADRSHFGVKKAAGGPFYYPAYHGEISIDPASGTIIRITIQNLGRKDNFLVRSSILVEYEPTEIGGVSYVCPFRGVALVEPSIPWQTGMPQFRLSQVRFS